MALTKLQPREKKLLILLLIVLIGASIYYLYTFEMQRLTEAKTELNQKFNQFKTKSIMAAEYEKVKSEYQALQQKINNKQERNFLIDGEEVELILDLQENAFAVDLNSVTIRPGNQTVEGNYLKLPISINFKGDYPSILAYFKSLDKLEYSVELENLSFISDVTPQDEYQVRITLVTYLLNQKGGDK